VSSIPYESATSGDKALTEIQRLLGKFGCQSFGTMTDAERGLTIVQFKFRERQVSLEASWKGYAAAWMKAHPLSTYRSYDRAAYDRKALEIGKVAVCSVLRDWIKGQMTAVECGIMSFDAVFMPHMLLSSGERLIDRVESSGLLPKPDDKKVLEFKP
jgi:hypothetical protein